MAAYQVGTHALHQGGILVVVPMKYEAVTACEHSGCVERPLDGLPRTFHAAGVCNGNNRSQQRLAGGRRPNNRIRPRAFLHYHDAESVGTGALGGSHSDWTPADDHHVLDAL